jgi:hypothetical protein
MHALLEVQVEVNMELLRQEILRQLVHLKVILEELLIQDILIMVEQEGVVLDL